MRARYSSLLPIAASLIATQIPAQGRGARDREAPFNTSTNPLLSSFTFRSIGPASMGGRLDDIEVSLSDPNVIYIGYAVGGVFKSEDNGVSFKPVFQTYGSASIGDIAIHPTNPDIVYVGTGEPNNRQTSSFGDGIYKSTDGGKTFTNIGLKETQTIGRIVIDPSNPEVVYVASPGHLFGPNPERGIYKTTDGGKTWNKIKYIDENTGFTDIAIDPSNSNVLYAASYQRRRTSCCFNGGGPGSAIWKTDDAGKTWTKLTNGLPPGTYGRIALSVAASNPNIVYAQVEAGESGGELRGRGGAAATEAATPAGGAGGGGGGRGVDPSLVLQQRRAERATGGRGRGRGAAADSTPALPPLDPKLGGVFRSDNRGRSFTLVSNCNSRPMYFSQLRVDPQNPNTIYVAGLPVAKSLDGGKTFATLDDAGGNESPAHVDQHAIWVDPRNSKHLMIGNDGGLDISYDQGTHVGFRGDDGDWSRVHRDRRHEHPYNVYTGLQDNNSWGGPSSKRGRGGITNMDWFGICGGDGFYTGVNVNDPNFIFCESQDGNTSRYDLNAGQTMSIKPNAGPRVQLASAASAGTPAGEAACVDGRAPGGGRGGGGGGGRGGAGGRKNVINAMAARRIASTGTRPYDALAAQPEHHLSRRQPAVQVVRPRYVVGRERRPHQAGRPLQGHGDGRRRRQVAALQERRPVGVQHDHRGLRVAGDAGRRLGRHRRRQPAGQPRRRHSRSPKSARTSRACRRARSPATIRSGSRASTRRTSTPARRTSRSTGTAATTCTRTCSSRATTARRSRASRTTCPRTATCRSFAKIRRTRTCCSSAPNSGSSPRSTAASSGRSS